MHINELEKHMNDMAHLSKLLGGCLSVREARFLALAAATLPESLGGILEIGSFKGKSTTILAKSARLVSDSRISAVDPLTLPATTDPTIDSGESLPDVFWQTLRDNDVHSDVNFYQQRSAQLAETWTQPLRLLWIDGDHTYAGVRTDFNNFALHLRRGSIVAFHDVLHPVEGPIRTFCEQVLLSSDFGPCGVCGSIGWSQFIGSGPGASAYTTKKIRLYRKLSKLIQFVALNRTPKSTNPLRYKILRPLVPHGEIHPRDWYREVSRNFPSHEGNFALAAGV